MKSITIHNLEDQLEALIRQKAHQTKSSLNKTIQSLLRQALGLSGQHEKPKKHFQDFCGIWKSADAKAFAGYIKVFEQVDKDDWK